MRGKKAADDATQRRERMTTASDESGHRTMGRRRSSKINEHNVLNLSPFAVTFLTMTTPSAPSVDQDAARECIAPERTRVGHRWR